MKVNDRFLFGIVGGIGVLVVVAFGAALLRPAPAYQPDDTPEGVAYNYVLALLQDDFARARGYLDPLLRGYPRSAEEVALTVDKYAWAFRRGGEIGTVEVVRARTTGDRSAEVTMAYRLFRAGGLFASNTSGTSFQVRLSLRSSGWKVVGATAFWASCWDNLSGCR